MAVIGSGKLLKVSQHKMQHNISQGKNKTVDYKDKRLSKTDLQVCQASQESINR